MGLLRLRRIFRTALGLRVNLSDSGVSTSVGLRGNCFRRGQRDLRVTVGVPIVAGIVILAITGTAAARTCYTLLDRNDNVVYRDTFSPVDLSDAGEAARAQLRQRGEYLLISEEEHCPQVTFVFGPGGSTALSVDDFLGGLQPSTRASGGTITTPSQGARGSVSSAPSAPPAAPKRGSASDGSK